MMFRGPDSAVLAWYHARERACAPKTQSIGQSGREYAFRCANKKCRRAGTRVQVMARKGAIIDRCRVCGTPWTWTEAYTLTGQSQSGRGVRPLSSVETSADLASLIHALDQTEDLSPGHADLYIAWLCVGRKSIDEIALDATRIQLAGRQWLRRDVRRAIRHARGWLETQLSRRGMLLDSSVPRRAACG